MIDVRTATPDDIQAMAAVQVAGWREGFAGILPSELTPSAGELAQLLRERFEEPVPKRVVAELDGEVRGFCVFGPSRDAGSGPDVGEIWVLYVDPPVWRSGVGSELVGHALESLASEGFDQVTLWSAAANDRANAFYERLGFVLDGAEQTRPEFGNAREVRYRRGAVTRP